MSSGLSQEINWRMITVIIPRSKVKNTAPNLAVLMNFILTIEDFLV
jgi:hypothetical protein